MRVAALWGELFVLSHIGVSGPAPSAHEVHGAADVARNQPATSGTAS